MFLFDRSDFPEKRTIRENSLDPGVRIPWAFPRAPARDSHRPETLWGMLGTCRVMCWGTQVLLTRNNMGSGTSLSMQCCGKFMKTIDFHRFPLVFDDFRRFWCFGCVVFTIGPP